MDRAPFVFPIRFAAGDIAVQTTTRALSEQGVLVRCLEPPAEGTALQIRLYLPGAKQAVHLAAVVRELSKEEPGFWADFLDTSEEQRKQISNVIERRDRASASVPIGVIDLHPPHADPRRAFPRFNARFAVRFATVQDFVLEYAANISAGGVFVQTDNPPPLKSIVQVEMELPGGGVAVPSRCIVVHRVTTDEARRRGTLPGVGVQFMDADDEFRGRIDAAIAHILEGQQRSA